MEPENLPDQDTKEQHQGGSRRKPVKEVLSRFPPPVSEPDIRPLVKNDLDTFEFDTDVHEKIQFFEKRNRAVESVKKSIADYVTRSIKGLLDEYKTAATSTDDDDVSGVRTFLLTGSAPSPLPPPTTPPAVDLNEMTPLMEILYKDVKENRSNRLLRKFARTLAYRVKQKTECTKEDIESIGPVINDVILGILAKKMLSHKIEQLLGIGKERRVDVEDRGEEVIATDQYKIKFGWKIARRRGSETNVNCKGLEDDGARSKRKRRRSRRKRSAAAPKLPDVDCEELQNSVKELVKRKLEDCEQTLSLTFDAESELTPAPPYAPEEVSRGSSPCNLTFVDALDVSAIKMEDREITKINKVLERKSGKFDRKGKRIKLKGSPLVTKWEKQLMSSSSPEKSRNPSSSPLNQSPGLLRRNELKERKGERVSRKKRENVDTRDEEEENKKG